MINTCSNEDPTTTTLAILSTILLIASELLPYIKSTDGNGLLHLLTKVLKKIKTPQQLESDDALIEILSSE